MKRPKKIVPMDSGDSALLGQIYEQNREIIYHFAINFADNKTEAEDAMQEAFIKVIKHLPKLKNMSDGKRLSYLCATVKTTIVDLRRKRKPEVPLSDALFATLETREMNLLSNLSMNWELQELKDSLSPRDWLVLEGKHILGYSDEELAEILGVKACSIRMILSRAYKKANEILGVGV